MEKEVQRIINDIKKVKIQGAREVAKSILKAIEITATRSKAKTKEQFLKDVEEVAKKLIETRPTEPGARHAVVYVLTHASLSDLEIKSLKKHTIRLCEEFLRKIENALLSIAKFGSELIKDNDVILTHCHSHSVIAILQEAKRQGKKFRVIVTETRPLEQGILTARDLLKSNIDVTYSIDSAMGVLMKDATKVLVGCDAILLDGSIVNKIGTMPMAIVARHFGKPFYSAGGTIKITKKMPELETRHPKEIIDPKKLSGAKIVDPAFDLTPSEFIESIITEKGVYKPEMIGKVI